MTDRDQRNRKALMVGEQAIGWGATLITTALNQARTELAHHDGYPTKAPGASTPTATGDIRPPCTCNGVGCDTCTPSTYTTTERAAERRYELTTAITELHEAIDAWATQWNWIINQARHITGTRLTHHNAQRCTGKVDATCTNIASEHRHPGTGDSDNTLCDHCWMAACIVCHQRAPEGRRVTIADMTVDCCEACYRRHKRAAEKAA